MDAVTAFLLESVLSFSVLFLCIWCIKKVFERHLSAFAQYALWGILILKLIIPASLPSVVSPWNLISQPQNTTVTQYVPLENMALLQGFAGTGEAVENSGGNASDAAKVPVQTSISQRIAQPEANTAPVSVPVDWKALATAAWLGGAGLMLIWLFISAARIKRKLAKNDAGPAPAWVQSCLETCKKELNIKRDIRLALQHAFPVPAIMGVSRTVLILPVKTVAENDAASMRHILLHELTHYKNGDILAILGLNVLNAIYWFNPLVWVCLKLIRKDMETLCDSRVLGRLGKGKRQEYIHTVLQYTAPHAKSRLQAALSINDGRIHMKKRIKGMFLAKKTKARFKIPVILLSIVMAFVFFTTACQPSPEKPFIANKADSALEDKIKESAPSNIDLGVPGTLKDSFACKDKNVQVNIDATVTVPNVTAFPVVDVIPQELSMDFIKTAVQVLLEGKPVYEPKTSMTKTELQEQILELQKSLADPKHSSSDGLNADDPEIVEQTKELFNNRIKNYQKLMKTAPDSYESKEVKLEFKPAKYYEDKALYAENEADWKSSGDDQSKALLDEYENGQKMVLDAKLDNGYYSRLTVENYSGSASRWNRVSFGKGKSLTDRFEPDPGVPSGEMTASKEDAEAMGTDLISKLGIKDMVLTSSDAIVSSTDKPGMPKGWLVSGSGAKDTGKVYGYDLVFQRIYGGIPSSADPYVYTGENKFGPYYSPETIQVVVRNEGIVYFVWENPPKQANVENSNVSVKPFDEIMEVFKKQVSVEYTLEKLFGVGPDYPDYKKEIANLISGEIDITDIKLVMMRIAIKDKPGVYRMIPVWKFYGKDSVKQKKATDHSKFKLFGQQIPYETINAIDGSIIDGQLGY